MVGAMLMIAGCPPEDYDAVAPATLAEIDLIRNDADLTVQEQRTQLEALGLSPLLVNALLQDQRLGNQYGGDLRTAYGKIVEPDLSGLTPDEIQIFGDEASALDDELEVALTDEEAQAMVIFFDQYHLSTPAELDTFLAESPGSVPGKIPDGVLQALFVDFDPSLLLPSLP